MIAESGNRYGVDCLGIGSDICQGQPDSVVEWMRNGNWCRDKNFGEGSQKDSGFPKQPHWFRRIQDFHNIKGGLQKVGFNRTEIEKIMGMNWLRFYDENFDSKEN